MAQVTVKNVRKSYGKAGINAVENLDLTIPSGEFLCLLGPSGCGKTTTLRMIAGLENLTEGEIHIGDKLVDSVSEGAFVPPEKRGIGLVFQNYALWPHMTVEENIAFGLKLQGMEKAAREKNINSVMKRLGIERYRNRYPAEMSGGQQQRVALARMLAVQPDVILMDEPLSNLDAKLRLDMRSELKRLHAESGATFIFVTHDQWEAMTLATTIAVMSEGHLQQLGSPTDIYDRPANRFVAEFVGSLPINIIELSGDDTLELWIKEVLSAQSLSNVDIASVGLRPENIRFAVDGHPTPEKGTITCAARVIDIVPTGGSFIVELRIGETPFFAITSEADGLTAGEDAPIWVQSRHLHAFDASDNRVDIH
ncbi:ABC transporter ATP-binding protein [Celeribacter sp.]|uniref:ABC transporter ATP-binding protein n=1 Tax=Celeribacter sp. TaxID=1890673 RepID=UPI003A8E1B1C